MLKRKHATVPHRSSMTASGHVLKIKCILQMSLLRSLVVSDMKIKKYSHTYTTLPTICGQFSENILPYFHVEFELNVVLQNLMPTRVRIRQMTTTCR